MKLFLTFDKTVAKIIGKIPRKFHNTSSLIGVITVPTMWFVALLLYIPLSPASLRDVLPVLVLVPLATIIKFGFKRKRPPTIYAEAMRIKSYSFPSSHAYSAALAAGFLAINSIPVVAALLIAVIAIIGISRVHVGAHYPSDVIGGWLLAAAVLVLLT